MKNINHILFSRFLGYNSMFNTHTNLFFIFGIIFGYFFHVEIMYTFIISILVTALIIIKKYIDGPPLYISKLLPYYVLIIIAGNIFMLHRLEKN